MGLDIHEAPGFHDNPANTNVITPGYVFNIEPGLYYPEQGMGCRIEDVVWIDENGIAHTLTKYPYDLVVPMSEKSRLLKAGVGNPPNTLERSFAKTYSIPLILWDSIVADLPPFFTIRVEAA